MIKVSVTQCKLVGSVVCTQLLTYMYMDSSYHTYGSRCIEGLARVLNIKPVHLKFCNFHFHYGSNLTSSGIQVKSMHNVNCTLKIVGKYYI